MTCISTTAATSCDWPRAAVLGGCCAVGTKRCKQCCLLCLRHSVTGSGTCCRQPHHTSPAAQLMVQLHGRQGQQTLSACCTCCTSTSCTVVVVQSSAASAWHTLQQLTMLMVCCVARAGLWHCRAGCDSTSSSAEGATEEAAAAAACRFRKGQQQKQQCSRSPPAASAGNHAGE